MSERKEELSKAKQKETYLFSETICIKIEFTRWEKESLDELFSQINDDLEIRRIDKPTSSTVVMELVGRNYCAFNRVINFVLQEIRKNPSLFLSGFFITKEVTENKQDEHNK